MEPLKLLGDEVSLHLLDVVPQIDVVLQQVTLFLVFLFSISLILIPYIIKVAFALSLHFLQSFLQLLLYNCDLNVLLCDFSFILLNQIILLRNYTFFV